VRAAIARHVRIPKNLAEAQKNPEWPQWKAAIEKEIGGLINLGVYTQIDRGLATTKVVPTQMPFDFKLDGRFKCRFVVRGDLTTKGEHYLETRSSMVSMEAVRTVIALAAGNDWALTTTDFSQAYCYADEENKNLLCELPNLPGELRNGAFGEGFVGKRTGKVAHMQKNLYGLAQAGRAWAAHLSSVLLGASVGAELAFNDRNVFSWSWVCPAGESHRVLGCVHVDDMLLAYSSPVAKGDFLRRLKQHFAMAGGGDEATQFCGLTIERDWAKKTIKVSQEAFARKMMDSHGVWGTKAEATPSLCQRRSLSPRQRNPPRTTCTGT
jgi:hypothetical protein